MRWVHEQRQGVIAPGGTCPDLARKGLFDLVKRLQPIS
jgi:hypothetical protein